MKKLIGDTEVEDSLSRLDKLTQEEARMASAELLKVTHGIDSKVVGVDDSVKDVEEKVQGVRGDVQEVHGDVQDIGNKVQVSITGCKALTARSEAPMTSWTTSTVRYLFNTFSSFRALTQVHREPPQRKSFTMAFAPGSVHQSQHCIQSSSQGYSSMVFSRQSIQSVEIYRLLLMDTRKACVTINLRHATTPDHLLFP